MRRITFLVLLTVNTILYSQTEFSQGFQYLEQGQYEQAEQFFTQILQTQPKNITALICYGRALGLNGKTSQAVSHFEKLLSQKPDELEVQLNYAESLLWNRNYAEAEVYYHKLKTQYPKNSTLLLGYANTLSQLKKYPQALETIQTAFALDSLNPGIRMSKKYIHLGYAYQLSQQQEYEKAHDLLQENFTFLPLDRETTFSLFDLYIRQNKLTQADKVLGQWPPISADDSLQYNIHKALLKHLEHKERAALQFAQKSIEAIESSTPTSLQKSAYERYIQSLIWNRKWKQAESALTAYAKYFSDEEMLILQSQISTYKGNFKQSLQLSQQIIALRPTSFDGQLGKANAYLGMRQYQKAYEQLQAADSLFPHQKDIQSMQRKLQFRLHPTLENHSFYTQDNAKNTSFNTQFTLKYPLHYNLTLLSAMHYRKTVDVNTSSAENYVYRLGYEWLIHPRWNWTSSIENYRSRGFNTYTKWLLHSQLDYRINSLSTLQIGFSQIAENFNSQLSQQELIGSHAYAIVNYFTPHKVGLYSQYYLTHYSDDNQRQLWYASLYYAMGHNPLLKWAFNYQNIQFKNSYPERYFSPQKFHLTEGMIMVESPYYEDQPSQWMYRFTLGLGQQFIEQNASQFTSRFKIEIGYRWHHKYRIQLYGGHSNISTSNTSGFAFTEIGIIGNILF